MTSPNKKSLVIAAGGTGGHIYPALAVWQELKQRHPDLELTWIGSSHRMESKLIPEMGIKFEPLTITEIKRDKSAKGLFYNIKSMANLNKAIGQSRKILKDLNPALVLATGGFVAGAAGLAAPAARVPLVLIEPNAYPGLTNRKLGPLADSIFIAYPETVEFFPKDKTYNFGVPVRKEIFSVTREEARKKLDLDDDTFYLMAIGGSQGADGINLNLPFGMLGVVREDATIKVRVIHQAGAGKVDNARVFREELPDDMYEVVEFIEDVPTHLAAADLIVSRAGASSLAEIAAKGIPAILFPLPKSAEDHQLKNARAWEREGAAVVLEDYKTNVDDLKVMLIDLIFDPDRRAALGQSARKFAQPDSAKKIADKLEKYF